VKLACHHLVLFVIFSLMHASSWVKDYTFAVAMSMLFFGVVSCWAYKQEVDPCWVEWRPRSHSISFFLSFEVYNFTS
jgi:hypothetical protein